MCFRIKDPATKAADTADLAARVAGASALQKGCTILVPAKQDCIDDGKQVEQAGDPFATSVQLAARLCANAAAVQILVSRVVADLCAGAGLPFGDRAAVRF